MAKDYKKLANDIIRLSGGTSNITSATHCMTRLRLHLNDGAKFQKEDINKLDDVLMVVIQNGEYQIVIGQDVPNLYAEIQKIDGIHAQGQVEDEEAA